MLVAILPVAVSMVRESLTSDNFERNVFERKNGGPSFIKCELHREICVGL